MIRWKHVLAFLITPLGTPISFAVWSNIAFTPGSFSGIISVFPTFVFYTAPAAYAVTLLFGIPAILILSRKKRLSFPVIVFTGTLTGTITGLYAGFFISGYDISGMKDYFTFDLISIYAPSTISGMVCSLMYWLIRRIR